MLNCKTSEASFSKLRDVVLPKAEKIANDSKLKTFFHAVSQWIFAEEIYSINFTKVSDFKLDYLLQTAIVSDKV